MVEPSASNISQEYFDSLSEKEKKAFLIAESHLGSLFTVEKTAGFIKWKLKQETTK
jgi:hypothetical protein